MNILILNTQVPFCYGGAEVLAEDLVAALLEQGHNAEIMTIPFKWYPQESLVNHILACKLLDIDSSVDKVIGLKFPAWLVNHPNKSYWILHQHRTAYDLWNTQFSDLNHMPDGKQVRNLIRREDTASLSQEKNIYTISNTVSERLLQYNGISSEALYPPPRNIEHFYCGEYNDYFYFPSRINPIKRQELVIEALAHTQEPVKIVFSGKADSDDYFQQLKQQASSLGVEHQITWLGHISEQEKFELYANALMVLFTPYQEDYGYITPEAMFSSKGVITLEDAGGAIEFVKDQQTGLVAKADAIDLAAKLDQAWSDRALAKQLGNHAKTMVEAMDINWAKVIEALL
ncbi:glycosyltransferase family 4 protein [Oceanicoccus sagamiensis]|uniref:Glycosyl transferase n=1 Tax=Oceanicoccus sagamiensis TaxID=716816 RepID=A0A1X9NCS0_9GAMM|nr:glycosyltransferase family 4 protein [Oceanicoccus sagamiensis]ARN74951.1 glycosyl transferase [Oceanicoccus sagamiensis]